MPKAVVEVHAQLTVSGEPLHRLALPDRCIAGDVLADDGGQHEKAAVDPAAVPGRLLLEPRYTVALETYRPEAPGRLRRRHRRQPARLPVQLNDLPDVHIPDTVSIGDTEEWISLHIPQDALDPPPDHRIVAGVHQRDRPRFGLGLMHGHAVLAQVKRHIGIVQEIVLKVLLDDVALVSEA